MGNQSLNIGGAVNFVGSLGSTFSLIILVSSGRYLAVASSSAKSLASEGTDPYSLALGPPGLRSGFDKILVVSVSI